MTVLSVLLVLHSKYPSVAAPWGFAPPINVALVEVRQHTPFVVTVGAGCVAGVVKLRILPRVVPALFVATTRK